MSGQRRIVLATSNPGKIRELAQILPSGVEVLSLGDVGVDPPEETGATFAENAAIKSVPLSVNVEWVVVADDSGLEVDALNGEPGVRSARYAGEPPDDQRNIDLLLARLAGVPDSARTARFRCAVSVAWQGAELLTGSGTCEGRIGYERRGDHGFGYDPIFMLDNGRTMAELTSEEKNRISHRARALGEVAERLAMLIDELHSTGDVSP